MNIQRKSNLSNELFQIIILSSPAFGHWHPYLFHQFRPQRPSVYAWDKYLATNDLSATNSLSSVFRLSRQETQSHSAALPMFFDYLSHDMRETPHSSLVIVIRSDKIHLAKVNLRLPLPNLDSGVEFENFAHALLYANRRECQAIFFTKDFQRRRPSVRRALNVHPRVTREASAIPELNGNAERAADSPKGEGLNSRKDESCHAIRYHATSTLSNKKKNNLFPCTTSILGYCIHTKRLRQRSNSKGT